MIIAAIMLGSVAGVVASLIGFAAFGLTVSAAFTLYLACSLVPAAVTLVASAAQVVSHSRRDLAPQSDF